jgi:hypothetical protein
MLSLRQPGAERRTRERTISGLSQSRFAMSGGLFCSGIGCAEGRRSGGRPRADAQPVVDPLEMLLHRRREHVDARRDLLVRAALGDEREHLLLPLCEPDARSAAASSRPRSGRSETTDGERKRASTARPFAPATTGSDGSGALRAWGAQTRSRSKSRISRPVSPVHATPSGQLDASPGLGSSAECPTRTRGFLGPAGQSDPTVNLPVFRRHPCGASALRSACKSG